MDKPLIVAHRGASALARENTVASFAKAIEIGSDMVEFDVRRSKDGIMVVYHDPAIAGRLISQLTYREANDLAQSRKFVIPTLENVLQLTWGKIKLDVELKETGYEKRVVDLVLKFFNVDDFIMTSFKDQAVGTVKKSFPEVKTGLLLGYNQPFQPLILSWPDLYPERRCRKIGADCLIVHYRLLTRGFLDRARRHGKPVYVWTVDDPKILKKLLTDNRIEGVITNKPDLAISLLSA